MNIVFIGVGTNMGDRIAQIKMAYAAIESAIGPIIKKSSYYKTPPFEFESTEDFINTVIKIETKLSIVELLVALKKIEKLHGRLNQAPEKGYQDRPIDLDILDFNNLKFSNKNLDVPHLKMHQRNFVIFPLAEIAPKWIHPALNKGVNELMNDLRNDTLIEKYVELAN